MRTRIRASIGITVFVAILAVAAAAPASSISGTPGTPARTDGSGSGAGSLPGGAGGPDVGSVPRDEPCGETVTHGTGPDATVSFTPCPDEEPPVEPQPQVIEPTPGMADVHALPFDTASIGSDDRTVTIDFVSGIEPCYVLDHVRVVYDADAVTISLYEGHSPTGEDVACIDIGVFKRVIVTLDEPLAGRMIVDAGATG